MVYNHLKDKVKAFLAPFAETGVPVGADDIKSYFEKLRGDDGAIQGAAAAVRGGGRGGRDDGTDRGRGGGKGDGSGTGNGNGNAGGSGFKDSRREQDGESVDLTCIVHCVYITTMLISMALTPLRSNIG